jgi:hypothetical protein
MQSMTVVKHGDVVQYVLMRFTTCLIMPPLNPLLFQAAKEAFHHGIVPAVPFAMGWTPPHLTGINVPKW